MRFSACAAPHPWPHLFNPALPGRTQLDPLTESPRHLLISRAGQPQGYGLDGVLGPDPEAGSSTPPAPAERGRGVVPHSVALASSSHIDILHIGPSEPPKLKGPSSNYPLAYGAYALLRKCRGRGDSITRRKISSAVWPAASGGGPL